MKTAICKLTRATLATGVHGITGSDIDEGTLAAGTLVRNCVTHAPNVDGGIETTFQASTDGGATWYDQRSFEDFAGDRLVNAGPIEVITRDGHGVVAPKTTEIRTGQWIVVANATPDRGQSDRGDLVSVHETEADAHAAAGLVVNQDTGQFLRAPASGHHRGVLTVGQAGIQRTPRGAVLIDG